MTNTGTLPEETTKGLDAEAVRQAAQAMLEDKLYWFPVRHHSPTVAIFLEKALRKRKPRIIFIEGPADASHLIPYVVDKQTLPPVAIYASYRDDDNVLKLNGIASPAENIPARFSSWYPIVPYSPEYVAMQVGTELGADIMFVDLPHYALIDPKKYFRGPAGTPDSDLEEDNGDESDERKDTSGVSDKAQNDKSKDDKKRDDENNPSRNDDLLITESTFYQTLTEVAGYRTWNEAWDSIFELREFAGIEEFRTEFAHFLAAVRATTHPERMKIDGTLERERCMWQTINKTLKEKNIDPEDAFVVTGGFHMFLDRTDVTPPPQWPAGTVYSTVVPYSFYRISEISGYASGNRAPAYYQMMFDMSKAGKREELVVRHVVNVLDQGRKLKLPLSSADAISICQHADMLALMRGRPLPVLDDIHDALITCCCKGDPRQEGTHLQAAIGAADIGSKIGKVTKKLGQLPLLNDFYTQIKALELDEAVSANKRLKLELDKRQELGARRSAFFHRLLFLDLEFVKLLEAPSESTTGMMFKEKWSLVWDPVVESNIIELALMGDTIETAALSKLREEIAKDEDHAGRICRRLVEAIDMDLPHLITEVEDACSKAIDTDGRFTSLTWALSNLLVIDRYAVFRNLRRNLLEDLIERCYDRACFAILDIVAAPDNEQKAVVSSLQSLSEAATMGGRSQPLDLTLFLQHLRHGAAATEVPFLRGAMLGLLAELRDMSTQDLCIELSNLAKSSSEQLLTAGEFLEGIMSVSRTSIMLGADLLIGAVDELLRAADWDSFLIMLPRMRAAFEKLHSRQVDSLGSRVAARYGLAADEKVTELRTSLGAAAVIARIDKEVAAIMKEWDC